MRLFIAAEKLHVMNKLIVHLLLLAVQGEYIASPLKVTLSQRTVGAGVDWTSRDS